MSVVVTLMPPSFSSKRSCSPSRFSVFFNPRLLLSLLPEVATQPSSAASLHLGNFGAGGTGGGAGAAGGAGWDRNVPAGIQNRYVAFAGVGNYWFRSDRRTWRTDYSATATKQDNVVDDPNFDDTFAGVRLTSTFLQKFGEGDHGSYGNDTIVDENLSETTDWRVDMTNWVAINMTGHLALKVSLQWLYDNLPALKQVNLYPANDPGGTGTPTGTVFVEADDLDTIFTTALVIKY